MILTFWLSTLVSDLSGSTAAITWVETLIPCGFLIMIPALVAFGISGFRLGKTYRGALVKRKRERTLFIAANGIAILIPSALYLSYKAEPVRSTCPSTQCRPSN